MAILNNNPLIGSGGNQGYNINNSLRFRSSASTYLNRTPASAGNRRTWTWSAWVKRGTLTTAVSLYLFEGTPGSGKENPIVFGEGGSSDKFSFYGWNGSGFDFNLKTTQVFRDISAWYHLVVAVDTTQATSSNRVKIYVNGNQISAFDASTYPSQNYDMAINNNIAHRIGTGVESSSRYFDGYMADINFIDGSQKAASDFGETDTTTGVWKPKAYSGTYGTNGFYLKFSDIATTSGSNAGLGKDFSGNSNYWTTNNISVTAGTTYDAMTDVPTLTSATVANYCVANPLDNRGLTISGGNLNLSLATATWYTMRASMAFPTTGKYYWEYTVNDAGYNIVGILDANGSIAAGNYLYDNQYGYGWQCVSAAKGNNNVTSSYGSATTTGDVLMIAFDADNRSLFVGKNGTWFNSSNPATNTSPMYSSIPTTLTFFPAFGQYSTTSSAINFGQRPFSYTPPTGYVALNTYNLPDSTIKKGNSYMDATLYTGTGSSQSISGVNFQPDFVWIKERVGAADHGLYDAVRGVQKQLESNTTTAETTETTGLTAFNSNGFTVGALAQLNTNTDTYVGWSWKANGAGSSNTSGSITSTVSVNTTAGFSVVTFNSGAAGNKTVGHGLGVKPAMLILKNRDSGAAGSNWQVWHQSLSNQAQSYIQLNSTAAAGIDSQFWANAAPTSTVFSFESAYTFLASNNIVAYCFAEIAGFSRFGSYTGNGSADGPFIYTGFRPKFMMMKRTDSTGDWYMVDSSRATYNQIGPGLNPNTTSAEFTLGSPTGGALDFLSNGFKWRGTYIDMNANGGTYIYAAFAENPFKNALAR